MSSSTYEFDKGNMMAFRVSPVTSINEDNSGTTTEEFLKELALQGTQALVGELFELKTEDAEVGRTAFLPEPTMEIPREKPVPEGKAMTRWEKFAKERGIKNTKRDRLVWDEKTEDWKARYGAGRANNEQDEWAIEHNESLHKDVDPFTKMIQDKKGRVDKNKRGQARNLMEASGERVPGTVDLSSAIKRAKSSHSKVTAKSKLNKKTGHVNSALELAQISTASMGKFDELNKGEKQPSAMKRAPTAAKSKRTADMAQLDIVGEKRSNMKILSKIISGSASSATGSKRVDSRKAANMEINNQQKQNHDQKKDRMRKKMKK